MKTILYVNPKAGQGKPLKYLKGVLAGIEDNDPNFEVVLAENKTAGLGKLQELAPTAGRILCLGGDGTVHDVAKICIENDLSLVIIPAGSGDDIAHSIGIDTPKTQNGYRSLLKAFLRPTVDERYISTGKIIFPKSTHYVLGVMSSGFDAHCNSIANTLKVRGAIRYVLAMLIGLRSFFPISMKITVDGVESSRDIMMMAIGNGPSYGSGMKVVPHADPFDDSLGAIIVNKCTKPTFLKIFPRVFKGTHVEHELVESLTFSILRVEIDQSQPIYGDGEYFDNGTFEITSMPRSLRVIIP
ncbi:MAG: diacylglycerol/lipid kinase family protein [Candidatus Nanopelagicales bacterium]